MNWQRLIRVPIIIMIGMQSGAAAEAAEAPDCDWQAQPALEECLVENYLGEPFDELDAYLHFINFQRVNTSPEFAYYFRDGWFGIYRAVVLAWEVDGRITQIKVR